MLREGTWAACALALGFWQPIRSGSAPGRFLSASARRAHGRIKAYRLDVAKAAKAEALSRTGALRRIWTCRGATCFRRLRKWRAL